MSFAEEIQLRKLFFDLVARGGVPLLPLKWAPAAADSRVSWRYWFRPRRYDISSLYIYLSLIFMEQSKFTKPDSPTSALPVRSFVYWSFIWRPFTEMVWRCWKRPVCRWVTGRIRAEKKDSVANLSVTATVLGPISEKEESSKGTKKLANYPPWLRKELNTTRSQQVPTLKHNRKIIKLIQLSKQFL